MSLPNKENQKQNKQSGHRRIKKFLSFYKPYKLLFTADLACTLITILAALALPLCIRHITGEVLTLAPAEAVPLIWKALLVMLAIIVVQTASRVFMDYKGHAMGAMMERDMREELFRHCQRLPVSFYDREKTGNLMSRITNDLLNLAEVCHHGPETILEYLVTYVGAFIILFRIDAKLTLVIFAFQPVLILYTFFFQKKLQRVYRESREKIAHLNARLEDTLAGVRVVKTFTNEKLEDEKFHRANESFYHGRVNIYRNEAYYYSVMEEFFSPLVIVGAVAAGGILISRSILSAPDLIAYLLYIGYLTRPIIKIAGVVGMYQDAFAGFKRFMEILDLEPEIAVPALGPRALDPGAGALPDVSVSGSGERPMEKVSPAIQGRLEFLDLKFSYGEELENVFENITLDIRPGESVALVGSSGSGKTTLCSLIPRFYEPRAGRILLDGTDIRDMSLETLRQNIGVVAQDVYLFDGTVIENIRYGKPGAREDEIILAAKRANAHEFIMALPGKYETEIGQRGIRLSGGQKQRLSIARVFLKDPPVLILDEATSSLDYESERLVHESLDNFMKDRTALIVAHRFSTIQKARRIISLTERGITELEKDSLREDFML